MSLISFISFSFLSLNEMKFYFWRPESQWGRIFQTEGVQDCIRDVWKINALHTAWWGKQDQAVQLLQSSLPLPSCTRAAWSSSGIHWPGWEGAYEMKIEVTFLGNNSFKLNLHGGWKILLILSSPLLCSLSPTSGALSLRYFFSLILKWKTSHRLILENALLFS